MKLLFLIKPLLKKLKLYNKMKNFRYTAFKQSHLLVRKFQLNNDEIRSVHFNFQVKPRLFNLDLHISVIRDLQVEFRKQSIGLTSWSISNHNHLIRKLFKYPDPVLHVNAQQWKLLDESIIEKFQLEYGKFLKTFDGFVVTHTPAIAELYNNFKKPILIDITTRYEAPYTQDQKSWSRINEVFKTGNANGTITFLSNNAGDRDYFNFFTGITPQLVPSVCDYNLVNWRRSNGQLNIYIARDPQIQDTIERITTSNWKSFKKVFGINYKDNQFMKVASIFVIPQNISTMQLFELAHSGIPVIVPSKKMMKELWRSNSNVISELSYYQVLNLDTSKLNDDNPNKIVKSSVFDWWLDRADFYNEFLMPNVATVDSFEELNDYQYNRNEDEWSKIMLNRYNTLVGLRNLAVKSFCNSL